MKKRVTKAIFPVAGLGTRFLPATKSVPKEIMTLVDRPLIQYAIDEARAAGIKEFIFVTSRGKSALEDYFDHSPELENQLRKKGKTELLETLKSTNMDSGAIAYIRQHKPLGLGHAVWCARRLLANEPFAVILPDDVIAAETPCLQQMVEAYAELGGNIGRRDGSARQPDERLWHARCEGGHGLGRFREGHGREAQDRRGAVEPCGDRPLHPQPAGHVEPQQAQVRRRRRDPADRCHRAGDREFRKRLRVPVPGASGSTAGPRPVSFRRPWPSQWRARICGTSSPIS